MSSNALRYRTEPFRRVILFPKAPSRVRAPITFAGPGMHFRGDEHPEAASRETFVGLLAVNSRQHYRASETPWWERRVSGSVVVATILAGLVIGWLIAIPLINAASR